MWGLGGGVDGPPEKTILIEIYVPKLPKNMPQPLLPPASLGQTKYPSDTP